MVIIYVLTTHNQEIQRQVLLIQDNKTTYPRPLHLSKEGVHA